jgi:DNA-binding CsgD family transcriptional regulator
MDDGPPAGNRFVGRDREMGGLRAALDDALSGRGRLVMLAGEPGIGKTRTAQELASHAETLGAQVLWGWCYEGEGAPPYWPWVQPMRSYVQQRDPEQLRAEMGPGAADIAEVIPEVRAKLPDLEPPPPLEPDQARFRLFDSIARFLGSAAKSRPMVLVLDDLHWADRPSLLLLHFLARQLGGCPMLVVGTYRDVEVSRQHPLSEILAQLSRLPVFMQFELKGLDREDTADFIHSVSGVRPRPLMAEALYSHTEGNPFFMSQVVRLLSERPDLASAEVFSPEDIGLPAGVRAAIGQRLNRLSARCNETLSMASAIGRGFDFRLLRALTPQVSEDQLLEVIDEALGSHLIEGLPGGEERYQFSHALVQQTLSEALSASRRVRLHARIAEALEAFYGADVEAHAAELAHHFAEAQTVLGTDKLVHYSLLAGERALAAYAWEEALAYFQRGLTGQGVPLTGTEPAKDGQDAALLAGLGRAQSAALPRHQLREFVTSLRRAVDYYVRSGDVARAVAIAEYPVQTLVGLRTDMAQLIAQVLPLVAPGSHTAGRVLGNYGFYLGLEEVDYQGAQEAFRQALAIAQGEGDTALEAQVLANACQVDFWHLEPQETIRKGQQAIELARSAGEPFAEARGHMWNCQAMLLTGDLEGAQQYASAMLALAEQLHERDLLSVALTRNQVVHHLEGDWATAREFHRRLMEVTPQDVRHLCYRALLEYETGNLAEGQQQLERIREVVPLAVPGPSPWYAFPAIMLPAIARICGVIDHLDVAEAAARTILSAPPATPMVESIARSGLGLLAVLRQDGAAAGEHYPALEPRRGTMAGPGYPSMDRLLGLLAHTMGLIDQAKIHFEEALTFCRKAGYRPELAWTCHDYAEALFVGASRSNRDAPTSSDRTKALSLLDEALAISTQLGMRPLLERVTSLKTRLESHPKAPPAYPHGLTHREVEVLRLIAAGRSNRAIAEELFISPNTAGHHVSNILNKINAANRTEAAAYAARHGLLL